MIYTQFTNHDVHTTLWSLYTLVEQHTVYNVHSTHKSVMPEQAEQCSLEKYDHPQCRDQVGLGRNALETSLSAISYTSQVSFLATNKRSHLRLRKTLVLMTPDDKIQEPCKALLLNTVLCILPMLDPILMKNKNVEPVVSRIAWNFLWSNPSVHKSKGNYQFCGILVLVTFDPALPTAATIFLKNYYLGNCQ